MHAGENFCLTALELVRRAFSLPLDLNCNIVSYRVLSLLAPRPELHLQALLGLHPTRDCRSRDWSASISRGPIPSCFLYLPPRPIGSVSLGNPA